VSQEGYNITWLLVLKLILKTATKLNLAKKTHPQTKEILKFGDFLKQEYCNK
jgi:hypothetical protein